MCLQTDIHVRLVFWCCTISVLLLAGAATSGFVFAFKMKERVEHFAVFSEPYMETMCMTMMVVCALVAIVCLATFVALLLDWYPLLMAHGVALAILSIAGMAAGLWLLFTARSLGPRGLLQRIVADMELLLLSPDEFTHTQTLLDNVQKDLRCCGVYHYKDYEKVPTGRGIEATDLIPLPLSCCIEAKKSCNKDTIEHTSEGCLGKLAVLAATTFAIYGILLFVLSAALMIDAGLVFILARRAKEFYHFYPYYL